MSRYEDLILSTKPPLDQLVYSMDPDDLTFFGEQTGLHGEQLKDHILSVRRQAYQIYHYPCIRFCTFTKSNMRQLPAYPRVLNILTKNPNALFLEIGCFLGVDIRKVVADGWPIENVVASDLRSEFWPCGHQLFKSTPETFPVTFIPGDVFDPAFISPRKPFCRPEEPPRLDQPLSSLTLLTPLQGRFHAIHATNLFHLFDEAGQLQLARQLATLLSPTPGSMIIGLHAGSAKKSLQTGMEPLGVTGRTLFIYSPQTWEKLWDGQVFEKGTVRVEASLHAVEKKDVNDGSVGWFNLCWSVTML